MRPEHCHYDALETWFQESISKGREFLFDSKLFDEELRRLWEEYEGVPYETLLSFVRNLHVVHVKKKAAAVQKNISLYLDKYKKGSSLKDLSKEANYPPYLFARYIVAELTTVPKKSLTEAMRNPERELVSIDVISPEYHSSEQVKRPTEGFSTRLAMEVREVIGCDPMYGPRHDRDRQMVGVEYEVVLEHYLQEMDVPFETEKDLRDRGTSRTPDVLLSCPLGVEVPKKDGSGTEWKVICWIDSKALFGDVNTHQTSVLPQAESYVHRFGPGLVLYWFGHAPLDRLEHAQGDIVITAWQVPATFMLPTGQVVKREDERQSTKILQSDLD